jgi:hypothetical protein
LFNKRRSETGLASWSERDTNTITQADIRTGIRHVETTLWGILLYFGVVTGMEDYSKMAAF